MLRDRGGKLINLGRLRKWVHVRDQLLFRSDKPEEFLRKRRDTHKTCQKRRSASAQCTDHTCFLNPHDCAHLQGMGSLEAPCFALVPVKSRPHGRARLDVGQGRIQMYQGAHNQKI